jgi:hypothetical protein
MFNKIAGTNGLKGSMRKLIQQMNPSRDLQKIVYTCRPQLQREDQVQSNLQAVISAD